MAEQIRPTGRGGMPLPAQKDESKIDLSAALASASKVLQNPPPPHKVGPFKVQAIALGFFGGARRKEGDIFLIQSEKQLGKWMKVL